MKRIILLVIMIMIFTAGQSFADTITAASCSQTDVQAAIDSASAGDTVLVPSGTEVWTQAIEITKPISIIGAGINNTKLTAGWSSSRNHFFHLTNINSTEIVRISGFYFDLVDFTSLCSAIIINNVSIKNLRIDHNEFHHGYEQIEVGGSKGVIDNNYFYNPLKGISFSGGTIEQANESWESLEAGTDDALFIENNHFIINENYLETYSQENIGTFNGGKLVIRNNIFDSNQSPLNVTIDPFMSHGSHGFDTPSDQDHYWQQGGGARRGQPVVEVYNNIMIGKRIDWMVIARGSSNLIYDNSIELSGGYAPKIMLREEEYEFYPAFDPLREDWPAEDQVHNSFIWNNSYEWNNSSGIVGILSIPDETKIQLNRDYYLHEPQSTGGYEYFTGKNGGSATYPTDGEKYPTLGNLVHEPTGPNAYYPYVPYVYPHPLTLDDYPGQRALELSVNMTETHITLAWNAVDGATSYKISRNWQEVSIVTNTGYVEAAPIIDTGYIVQARNTLGDILSVEGVKFKKNPNTPQAPIVPAIHLLLLGPGD